MKPRFLPILLTILLACWSLTAAALPVSRQSAPATKVYAAGTGFEVKTLKNGAKAFANRSYAWENVPAALDGWQITQVSGGKQAQISIRAIDEGDVYVASVDPPDDELWIPVDGVTFSYNDKHHTTLHLYRRHLTARATLTIEQKGWAGVLVLAPQLPTGDELQAQANAIPPGCVIDFQALETRSYVGSPSIAKLPDGCIVVSHDIFGRSGNGDVTVVFRSTDRGATWKPTARLQNQFWSSLFVNEGSLYILGPDKSFGRIVIRRSDDDGFTWTTPEGPLSGVLSPDKGMHCAPTPVVEFNGRLWRAFERNPPGAKGRQFQAFVISAPVDSDLLRADSWSSTNALPYDPYATGGNWLEGNAVLAPDGSIVDILRIDKEGLEKAALLHVSPDGRRIDWNPGQDRIDFPGGAVKFTIRYDQVSKRYWSLVNKQRHPDALRNVLALTSSPDLVHWKVEATLLQHLDKDKHAFQYVDWVFDGDDIIAVARTSWDGDTFHNANYLTFHRIRNFRTNQRSLAR